MGTNAAFIAEYKQLLIRQYHEQTNALAEIEFEASQFSKVYSLFKEIIDLDMLDVDTAAGVWLDIIGKIVFGYDARDIAATGTTLTDTEYRFFIKVKIAKNSASAFMVSDEYITIQDVIQEAFSGAAYVADNYDMALTLYVDATVNATLLAQVNALELLPSGMGVRYRAFVRYTVDDTFGFDDNPQAKPWDDKTTPDANAGHFAEKI